MTITKKQRVDSLKSLKALANDYLDHYKVIANEKSKTWIHRKAELSIEQLTEIIKQINKDLHPDKVSAYCKPMPVGPSTTEKSLLAKVGGQFDLIREYFAEAMQQTNLNFALFEVAKHAPENNIIHDITWLSDGTIGDFIEIALGQKPITYFENYLVSKLFEVKQLLIPYFKLKQGFSERLNIIRQAIYHTQKKNYLISNILLITVTESIVRELCRFLFQKQNPIASREEIDDYVFNKFNSLDTLISKGNWQSDFPIPLFQAVGTYTDVNEETLNEWRKKNSEAQDRKC